MTDHRIEREVVIRAPLETIWAVITEPPHLCRWFSDDAHVDLRPGGRASFGWDGHGTYPAVIVEVDPPRRLSFRWIREEGLDLDEERSTLVVFELRSVEGATVLTVSESGFDSLPWPPDRRTRYADENDAGWRRELDELAVYMDVLISPDAR